MEKLLDGGERDFFKFMEEYQRLIQKHIPGTFHYEYDSRLYMLPVHRHLEKLVAELPPQAQVLDVGCGRGHYAAYLSRRNLRVRGIEVANPRPGDDFLQNQDCGVIKKYPALWRDAKKKYGASFRYFDGRKLPFQSGSFDAVLFYASYEHIPLDAVRMMTRESFRVLKPGGRAYIFRCPSRLAWKEHLTRRLGLGAHEKLYGKREILALLREAGYRLEAFGRSDFFPVHIVPIQGAVNRSAPFLLKAEKVLERTPLRLFFHHFEIALRKPTNA